jgi:hypothetical protein
MRTSEWSVIPPEVRAGGALTWTNGGKCAGWAPAVTLAVVDVAECSACVVN